MTAPRFRDCRCGHPKLSHELELAPQCIAERCSCLAYRPTPVVAEARPTPITAVGERPSSGSQLIAAGRRSYSKRTIALADKIAGLLDDLWTRLQDESANAAARREVEELEAKLAAAKARLRGATAANTVTPAVRSGEEAQCPECGKTVKAQGLGTHRAKAHGYRAAS